MACYSRFHWAPDAVRHLPYSEAVLLAVYFEETFRAEAKQVRDMENQAHTPATGSGWQTDLEVNADDEEEDDE